MSDNDAVRPEGLGDGGRFGGLAALVKRTQGKLGRDLAINLGGGIASQVALLVSGVVLAWALGPTNRGNMALLTLVNAIAWQLGGLGIPFALTYALARAPHAARRTLYSMRWSIASQAVIAAVVSAIVLGLLTKDRPSYVMVGAAMTAAAIIPTIYQRCALAVLQGLGKFFSFNALRMAPPVLFSFIIAILLIAGSRSFLPYAAAWAFSQAIIAPLTMWIAHREANRIDSGEGGPPSKGALLRFGRRSIFGGASPVETYRLDQSVVALFLSPAQLGYYVAALALTNLPRFIAQSFAVVATPTVAGRPTHRDATQTMWRISWLAVPFYLAATAILFVGAPLLIRFFFGADFAAAGGLSQILLGATALFCARRVLADASRGAGYPGIGSIAELVALFSSLPLFAALVPLWGLDGVAYALIGSSTIALTALVVALQYLTRGGRVPSSWKKIHDTPDDALMPART